MMGRVLVYGATGFTGRLLAQTLCRAGHDLVLAGRDGDELNSLSGEYGRPYRAFDLTDHATIVRALADVSVVVHAAGPFVDTAWPMMQACIKAQTHYLDLAGEWPVFREAMDLSDAARTAGVMLMPGIGFTLVASDCLMALAVARWPETTRLRLGISQPSVMTRGTVVTSGRMFESSVILRRSGRLEDRLAGHLNHVFDFGDGPAMATALSMPEVITGQFTTGVENIEVFLEAGWARRLTMRLCGEAAAMMPRRAIDTVSGVLSLAWPREPTPEAFDEADYVLVVEATDPWRRAKRLRMWSLDGYSVSRFTVREIVARVLRGEFTAGFQTPARQFGGDLILSLGCATLDQTLAA